MRYIVCIISFNFREIFPIIDYTRICKLNKQGPKCQVYIQHSRRQIYLRGSSTLRGNVRQKFESGSDKSIPRVDV